MAAQPSGVSATPLSFVSSGNLSKVQSIPSSRSLMKMLSETGPSTDPWGTLLAIGLQLDSAPLITAVWVLAVSQFSSHLTVHSSVPYFLPYILQGWSGRHCQMSCWSQSSGSCLLWQRWHHRRQLGWSSMISPWWIYADYSWDEKESRTNCSITFPETEVRLAGL